MKSKETRSREGAKQARRKTQEILTPAALDGGLGKAKRESVHHCATSGEDDGGSCAKRVGYSVVKEHAIHLYARAAQ
jgi:hypothetical protein